MSTPENTLIARRDLPLFGKRVLFCTPRNYAQKLAHLLVAHGALPVWTPTIVIEPLDAHDELDDAIRRLPEYEWIAFTSRNGIEAFFARLAALDLDTSTLAGVRISALGNDGKLLEAHGVSVDLLPEAASTRGVVDELRRRGVTSGRILLPVPEVFGMDEPSVIPDFVGWLKNLGMEPRRVPAYATHRVTEGLDAELALLCNDQIDVVAFTSVAEIDSLLLLLRERADALGRQTIACYGPVTANGARQHDLHVDVVADNYSAFEGYVAALEDYFRA